MDEIALKYIKGFTSTASVFKGNFAFSSRNVNDKGLDKIARLMA